MATTNDQPFNADQAAELPPYPLTFAPIYKQKVWGGRTLTKLGRDLPGGDDTTIGESWELVDLSTTSVSGGGGNPERSVIDQGSLEGMSLHEAISRFGRTIVGNLPLTDTGDFPLLVKFLDARENLSVQVHPSQSYTDAHDDAFLKSEAWYIVDCEPDAVIYKGMKAGVTADQLRKALETNTDEAVVPLLETVPVKPGECHYLPSGTCHALGAGVLVAEVQTPSDTTFRVYDWGRTGRELHIDQAIQCIDFGPCDASAYEPNVVVDGAYAQVRQLVRCEFFAMDQVVMSDGGLDEIAGGEPIVMMMLAGGAKISCDGSDDVSVAQGTTVLLPAGAGRSHVAADAGTRWIKVTFPQVTSTRMA